MAANISSLKHVVRKLRGSSRPILAMADNGEFYIVKIQSELRGANVLFNEAAGTELYRALGLPTPRWQLFHLPAEFAAQNSADISASEGHATTRQSIAFGSRYVWRSNNKARDILCSSAFARIKQPELFWLAWLTDVCARHTDNRQAIFLEASDRRIEPRFIDHGEMFGGAIGEAVPSPIASRYLDLRVYPPFTKETYRFIDRRVSSLDCDGLARRIRCIPTDWCTDSASRAFTSALDRLARRRAWQNLLHAILKIGSVTGILDDSNRRRNLLISSCNYCTQAFRAANSR